MPITIPVPEEYAKPFDAKSPSTYNTNVVASGPYMVENDAKGKLTGYKVGKSISLVRNPNWDKATDYRPAYLDEIDMEDQQRRPVGGRPAGARGLGQSFDTNPPAAELKDAAAEPQGPVRHRRRPAATATSRSTRRSSRSTTSTSARRSWRASTATRPRSRRAAARRPATSPTHFLPPGFPGFEEAGGAEGAGVDYLEEPARATWRSPRST